MKIIYMGTPDFAVGPLEAIIKAGHEVTAVVTQPDKQKGRGRELQITPVKECALRHQIPVLQPVKIRAAEAVLELKKFPADIFVVAAFGQILSEEILGMPQFGCINIHASLLPKYRGSAPIQWAVINGEKESGITIMQMDKGVDTGDMLLKKSVMLSEKETGDSLFDKLMQAGSKLIVEALIQIEKGLVVPEKQKGEELSHADRLTKSMGQIDWTKDAVSIERLIRGLNSWPSAYTSYRGKTIKIWEADVCHDVVTINRELRPGTVTEVAKNHFDVLTGEGVLRIHTIQLEGKRKMPVKDFLLGYELKKNEELS